MIQASVDLAGVDAYIGGVGGILDAVESPGFQGDFSDYVLGALRDKFRTETIAAHLAGNKRIAHVFEWPQQDARGVSTNTPNPQPLFALYKTGHGGIKMLSYRFLPSTMEVPLPDPSRYGFSEDKLLHLRRHIFRMKALVMETQNRVTIAPKYAKKLFIPDAKSKRGYFTTARSQSINPGGGQSVGGFAEWWNAWFEQRAPVVVNESTALAEETIAATGQRVVRYAAGTTRGGKKVGGQFASGTNVQVAYVNSAKRNAEAWMLAASKRVFRDEGDWEE